MDDDQFVQVDMAQILLCHGQAGNIRHLLSRASDAFGEGRFLDGMGFLRACQEEADFLVDYLPPNDLKLRHDK